MDMCVYTCIYTYIYIYMVYVIHTLCRRRLCHMLEKLYMYILCYIYVYIYIYMYILCYVYVYINVLIRHNMSKKLTDVYNCAPSVTCDTLTNDITCEQGCA